MDTLHTLLNACVILALVGKVVSCYLLITQKGYSRALLLWVGSIVLFFGSRWLLTL